MGEMREMREIHSSSEEEAFEEEAREEELPHKGLRLEYYDNEDYARAGGVAGAIPKVSSCYCRC
jgi:hypothetical protein